jgi:hypothetical protein
LFLVVYPFASDHFFVSYWLLFRHRDVWQAPASQDFLFHSLSGIIGYQICYEKNSLLDNDFDDVNKIQNKNSFFVLILISKEEVERLRSFL